MEQLHDQINIIFLKGGLSSHEEDTCHTSKVHNHTSFRRVKSA